MYIRQADKYELKLLAPGEKAKEKAIKHSYKEKFSKAIKISKMSHFRPY